MSRGIFNLVIMERIQDAGYDGGITIIKDYVQITTAKEYSSGKAL